MVGHHLEEDVVTSLCSKLVGDSGLLQQIWMGLYITRVRRSEYKYLNVIVKLRLRLCNLSSVNFILTCLNISTGQFTRCAEMDSDEFTLF